MNNSNPADRKKLIYQIKNKNRDAEVVAEIIEKVKESGGIGYAAQKMDEYRNSALEFLTRFPASEYKKSLENLVDFSTSRDK